MEAFASGFASLGGKVISIVPRWLEREGLVYQGAEPIYCNDLAERKHLMFEETDAVLCYPGGVGTWDELFDLLARRAVEAELCLFRPCLSIQLGEVLRSLDAANGDGGRAGLLHPQIFARVHSFETADALEESLAKEYPKGGAKIRDSEGGLPERSRRPAVAD